MAFVVAAAAHATIMKRGLTSKRPKTKYLGFIKPPTIIKLSQCSRHCDCAHFWVVLRYSRLDIFDFIKVGLA
jgi:hypothetical protein